ncbi:MAG: hypothetical protein INR69_17610 [Mucilaginibacter polytrichastri]|nr:hypothetical protein [Mucilaginibacter polytrichastri]
MPAGFWMNFHKDVIIKKYSDQGPWGGYRENHWRNESGKIHTKEVIEFAKLNGWDLVDSVSVMTDTLEMERIHRLKIDTYSNTILRQEILPTIKSARYLVFIFRTGWLAVEPGNANETFQNGFAVLSSDRSEFAIYHRWGE